MTAATQAARAELKNGASICIGVALLASYERSHPNDPAVKYLHKLRQIFIEGMGASYKVYPANMSLQLAARRHLKAGKQDRIG
ncbi:hypothetical protein [uncultured Campylobacter sp.]|uniref:hypothetical protein n=1 Tax=uncultured Campylobacter sp. TaxID=218934 RepID=UPI00262C748F|nr:hypothetical protein [uncultured Campylobacter sp.]